MPEPMAEARLADLEALHYERAFGECNECARPYPCVVLDLIAEVWRLRTHKVTRLTPTLFPEDLEQASP